MCGITGIIGEIDLLKGELSKMNKAQGHRGPDSSNSWQNIFIDAQIGFAHNQLKFTNLDDQTTQPFSDKDTGLIVLFDGEVHNYKELREQLSPHYTFTTNGMAEVLEKAYHRWGAGCLERFTGVFSFAIYDCSAQQLFLARDRFGVKPLYFALQRGNFYFASEIKALFAAGIRQQMSPKQWASYMVYSSYGMPYETFWEDIYQLPAGHYLSYNGYSMDVRKWYEFEKEIEKIEIEESEEEITNHFMSLAEESIRYNLNSDVSMGFNLSGGIDSSFLLGLIHKVAKNEPLKVYSHYCGDKRSNEILWTEEMLSHTQYKLEQVQLTPKMVIKEARYISRMQDEPFDGFSSLAYARLFRAARKRGTTVLCDGMGLDEVWGEYPQEKCNCMREDGTIPKFLNKEFAQLAKKPEYPRPFENEEDNLRYRDLFYERIPHLLRFNDRVSMAYSTELRKPFLDNRLIEYAFAIPKTLKLKKQDKWLIRKIASSLLPGDVRLAPQQKNSCIRKQDWLTGPLHDWVEESIIDLKTGKAAEWINGKNMEKEWHNYQNGTTNDSCDIWKWLNLQIMLAQ